MRARNDAARQFSMRRLALRAFDLSERTARAGRRSASERLHRWRRMAFLIIQCSVTAGIAWWVGSALLGHGAPTFAAIAAIITLGFSYGQRLSRALEIAVGVAVGVFVGLGFSLMFGNGVWQIVVVSVIAMSLATLLGAGHLMINQAGVQAVIVTAFPLASQGPPMDTWIDAMVGCALAMLVATIAPGSPVRRPLTIAAEVLQEAAGTLTSAVRALRAYDAEAADAVLDRARSSETHLEELEEAVEEGVAVVRYSPFRRQQREQVEAYADLAGPLDRLMRNLRVLARGAAVAGWRGNPMPEEYLELMSRLATIMGFMSRDMFDGRLPAAARSRLQQLAEDSAHVQITDTLSPVLILAQTRNMITDLLELMGVDAASARSSLPDVG
ncbi:MAG: FUSC family protein [Beutenbergiaceae bacterium]